MENRFQLIEKNLFDLYSYISLTSNYAELIKYPAFQYIVCKNSFWPNMVFNVTNIREYIESFSDQEKKNKIPPFIIINNNQLDAGTEDLLIQNNFRILTKWKAMDITPDTFNFCRSTDLDFEILTINNEKKLFNWIEIVSQELFNNKKIDIEIFRNGLVSENFTFYMGMYKGQPAATCLTFIKDNIAGFYMISTKNELRNKGFGSYITSTAVKDAFDQGYNCGILQATEGGEKIYKNIGFNYKGDLYIFWKMY